MSDLLTPQPPPQTVEGSVEVWPSLIRYYCEYDKAKFVDLLRARDMQGRHKYGKPLTTNDGRIGVADAFQEFADGAVYLHKAEIEARANGKTQEAAELRALVWDALTIAESVRDVAVRLGEVKP